jgi:hypothetical protein
VFEDEATADELACNNRFGDVDSCQNALTAERTGIKNSATKTRQLAASLASVVEVIACANATDRKRGRGSCNSAVGRRCCRIKDGESSAGRLTTGKGWNHRSEEETQRNILLMNKRVFTILVVFEWVLDDSGERETAAM